MWVWAVYNNIIKQYTVNTRVKAQIKNRVENKLKLTS